MDALIFDLFGTLVEAPTPDQRGHAASRLAALLDRDAGTIVHYLRTTWRTRHDGTLPTLVSAAADLIHNVQAPDSEIGAVAQELRDLGQARLIPDPSVADALDVLRGDGLRLGILSDASAEVAATWLDSPLAPLVDGAVFSCTAGAVKPDQRLYRTICDKLNVSPQQTLYVGDGGGDELHGARTAGMTAIAVRRRGRSDALAFNDALWQGPILDSVEDLPDYIAEHA